MNMLSKREYLQAITRRYHRSSKRVKSNILDEFCTICGYNRSYAIRLLNQGHKRKRRKPGRHSRYGGADFTQALKRIWLASEQLCGRRLKECMSWYVEYYPKHHGELSPEVKCLLLQISPATIDRVLKKTKAKYAGKGRSLTKPGSLLRNEIPLRVNFWDVSIPGFVEADTVAHCGQSSHGPFALTLTLTDIHTTWTECRAIWTKKSDGVIEQIDNIKKSLPFDLLGFDCDNGSEFLNDHLVRYFQNKKIPLTRSRPYKKNDNAHVEQKNWTHARQLFGHLRIENPDCVPLMNDIYANEWCYFKNFFQPSFKLKEKRLVGSKYKRIYDKPKTPLQRVLESTHVSDKRKEELKIIFNQLDPFSLKERIDQKARYVYKLTKIPYDLWKSNSKTESL